MHTFDNGLDRSLTADTPFNSVTTSTAQRAAGIIRSDSRDDGSRGLAAVHAAALPLVAEERTLKGSWIAHKLLTGRRPLEWINEGFDLLGKTTPADYNVSRRLQ